MGYQFKMQRGQFLILSQFSVVGLQEKTQGVANATSGFSYDMSSRYSVTTPLMALRSNGQGLLLCWYSLNVQPGTAAD
jgi:hypothetical protein